MRGHDGLLRKKHSDHPFLFQTRTTSTSSSDSCVECNFHHSSDFGSFEDPSEFPAQRSQLNYTCGVPVTPSVRGIQMFPAASSSLLGKPLPPLLRMVRPSLLDLRFTGDPWIVKSSAGPCKLCLGDTCLAGINAIGIDLPSLNLVLDRMRHRRPRPRS
jgi:hypothetical protein